MLSPEYTLDTMVMDVSQAATGPAPVGNYGKHGGPNQQFRLEQYTTTTIGTPIYRIHPMHAPGMCLDIAYADRVRADGRDGLDRAGAHVHTGADRAAPQPGPVRPAARQPALAPDQALQLA